MDTIDPRLEIDNTGVTDQGVSPVAWRERILWILLGVLVGAFLMRRRPVRVAVHLLPARLLKGGDVAMSSRLTVGSCWRGPRRRIVA